MNYPPERFYIIAKDFQYLERYSEELGLNHPSREALVVRGEGHFYAIVGLAVSAWDLAP